MTRVLCIAAIVVVCPGLAAADTTTDLTALRQQVDKSPDDVDLRLRYAISLSHAGKWAPARVQARRVVARAPEYWDAYMLLARVDAWSGDFKAAFKELDVLRRRAPDYKPTLVLTADVSFWAGDAARLRKIADELAQRGDTSEALFRSAQAAYLEGRHYEAHRAASQALPHPGAQKLRADIPLVRMGSFTSVEYWRRQTDNRPGVGEVVTATVFPEARVSFLASYEYLRRFAEHNHRFGGGVVWNAAPFRLSIGGAAASAKVLPTATGFAQLGYALTARFDVSGGYTYDRLPWAGNLHRANIDAGMNVTELIRADAGIVGGWVSHCGSRTFVYSAWLRGRWQAKPRVALVGGYGFGVEVDRPPLDGNGGTGQRCPTDIAPQLLEASDVLGHSVRGVVSFDVTTATSLSVGYIFMSWLNGSQAHVGQVAIQRTW